MSTPYLGQISIVSFNFPPKGWALCNGQLLSINQNQALFSILGTTYGGDGRVTFALPNLQGRVPVHVGNGIVLGESAGEAAHILNGSEMPQHTHVPAASASAASQGAATNNFWGNGNQAAYSATPNAVMNPGAIANAGGNQPHENMPPYLALNFVIALQGIFPSRN